MFSCLSVTSSWSYSQFLLVRKAGLFSGGGGRRRILDNGNLIISPVSRDDAGLYTCTASNSYGSDESKGRLIVLREYSAVHYFITVRICSAHRILHCAVSVTLLWIILHLVLHAVNYCEAFVDCCESYHWLPCHHVKF